MNSCVFVGRLAQDPVLNQSGAGTAVARFTLVENRVYKKERKTDYFDFQAWGATAEFLVKNFHKGDGIVVHSSAREDKWQTTDGQNRRKVVFNVNNVDFPPSKAKSQPQEEQVAVGVADEQQDLDF